MVSLVLVAVEALGPAREPEGVGPVAVGAHSVPLGGVGARETRMAALAGRLFDRVGLVARGASAVGGAQTASCGDLALVAGGTRRPPFQGSAVRIVAGAALVFGGAHPLRLAAMAGGAGLDLARLMLLMAGRACLMLGCRPGGGAAALDRVARSTGRLSSFGLMGAMAGATPCVLARRLRDASVAALAIDLRASRGAMHLVALGACLAVGSEAARLVTPSASSQVAVEVVGPVTGAAPLVGRRRCRLDSRRLRAVAGPAPSPGLQRRVLDVAAGTEPMGRWSTGGKNDPLFVLVAGGARLGR